MKRTLLALTLALLPALASAQTFTTGAASCRITDCAVVPYTRTDGTPATIWVGFGSTEGYVIYEGRTCRPYFGSGSFSAPSVSGYCLGFDASIGRNYMLTFQLDTVSYKRYVSGRGGGLRIVRQTTGGTFSVTYAVPELPPVDPLSIAETVRPLTSTCNATFTVGNGKGWAGRTGAPVAMKLTNDQVVLGVQVDVTDNSWIAATGCTSLVSGFACYYNDYGTYARAIFISLTGASIPVGTNVSIFKLLYDVSPSAGPQTIPLTPSGLLVADPNNQAGNATGVVGSFVIN